MQEMHFCNGNLWGWYAQVHHALCMHYVIHVENPKENYLKSILTTIQGYGAHSQSCHASTVLCMQSSGCKPWRGVGQVTRYYVLYTSHDFDVMGLYCPLTLAFTLCISSQVRWCLINHYDFCHGSANGFLQYHCVSFNPGGMTLPTP